MLPTRQTVELDHVPSRPRRFVFVLLPEFTMLCFSAAVESLRIANRLAGKPLYSWVLTGEAEDVVMSSAGVGAVMEESSHP